jgi:hypothetical protein
MLTFNGSICQRVEQPKGKPSKLINVMFRVEAYVK